MNTAKALPDWVTDPDQRMSYHDVAERFGLSIETVYKYLTNGRIYIEESIKIGRNRYFKRASVEKAYLHYVTQFNSE